MLSLNKHFKTIPMKTIRPLTVALGMIACIHSHGDYKLLLKDSTSAATCLIKNTPVVNYKKPVVKTAPDMPFFKDVLDTKRLFW
ncbi:hypothetical protein FC093_09690 [Ilyomonas limi]|uniref:Uncharacterized protein n=1 Tax=Ilyomonas limi TaxID=2575867 RepID=A0A4U3L5I1_9BACT|nr:hypothetical protein [Ilyomonas limi]TKK68956.1 hypothetical protein FC093_09690 [Ilyomonas limi]